MAARRELFEAGHCDDIEGTRRVSEKPQKTGTMPWNVGSPRPESSAAPPSSICVVIERFTNQARRAISLASEEARDLQCSTVDTDHLLVALSRPGSGVAAQSLKLIGITPEAIRKRLEVAPQLVGRPVHDPHHAARLEWVLLQSPIEADAMHHNFVGTEHILLSLIKAEESDPGPLRTLGVDLEDLRDQVVSLMPGSGEGSLPPPRRRTADELS